MRRLGFVDEVKVTGALALQWRCPVLKALPQQLVECGIPRVLFKKFQMLPVHFSAAARTLHMAFANDIEYPALLAIEQVLDCKTEACLTTAAGLRAVFERMEQEPALGEREFAGARDPTEMTRIASSYVRG